MPYATDPRRKPTTRGCASLVYNWIIIMATQNQLTHAQHTVPQWHLRNFADDNGDVWRYKQYEPVKRSRPKGECWELDFYEYELNGKKTANEYENWLGRIENDGATKLQRLIAGDQLDLLGATVWASYVASLFARSEKYRSQISAAMVQKFRTETQNPDFIRNLQHELLKEGQLVFADDLQKEIDGFREKMENSPSFYHLCGLQRNTVSLADAVMRKTWHVIQSPSEKYFLTSDCPVTTVELVDGQVKPGTGFAKEHTAIILAITPRALFVAASPTIQWKSEGCVRED